jgi:uncharacterized repeat protein (TIGR02543 family)
MNTQKIFDYGARNLLCAISVILTLTFTALSLTGCPTEDNGGDKTYTVTFDSDGGSDVSAQTITKGNKADKPADPTKAFTPLTAGLWLSNYTFAGWQKDGAAYDFDTPVTANITLTAVWTAPNSINLATRDEANIIAKAVAHINADDSGATEYTLALDADVENVAAIIHNKDGVTLTITSVDTTERTISKGTAANGTVFTVGGTLTGGTVTPSSAKLVIDGTVTLQGKDSNNSSVVRVTYGGSLELKGNAKITGNSTSSDGGGVYAVGNADVTITMSGNAEISGNTVSGSDPWGGGVYLSSADLTMSGNTAIKNNAISGTSSSSSTLGGGVYISNNYSTFTMNGGEISGNSAISSGTENARGGGVYVSGSFIVASEAVKANIKNNTVTNTDSGAAEGAQVFKSANGVFTVGGVAADTF